MKVMIGDRLRDLREYKKFSQGDMEKRTGLKRCYISRVERGHTVPSVETLEKFAQALEVPMYQLFYDGEESAAPLIGQKRHRASDNGWGSSGIHARFLSKLRNLLGRMEESDRQLLLVAIREMAARGKG